MPLDSAPATTGTNPLADAYDRCAEFFEQQAAQARRTAATLRAPEMFVAPRLPHEPPDALIDRKPAPRRRWWRLG